MRPCFRPRALALDDIDELHHCLLTDLEWGKTRTCARSRPRILQQSGPFLFPSYSYYKTSCKLQYVRDPQTPTRRRYIRQSGGLSLAAACLVTRQRGKSFPKKFPPFLFLFFPSSLLRILAPRRSSKTPRRKKEGRRRRLSA